MGAVNYGTSEYITIGLEPFNIDNYKYDEFSGEYDADAMQLDYECDYDNICSILAKYDFSFFHVEVKPGYYEGFYIDIECNNGLVFDCYSDKIDAIKELTQLKLFLLECVNNGLCEVLPGWCTSYRTREQSILSIKQAIKEAKQEIKGIPTWYYCKMHGIEI